MRKITLAIIVMLLVLPAISLPLGSWTNATVFEETDFFVVSQSINPPEGIVSWWTGDGNDYDYVGNNHGTIEAGATFAPGWVDEAFSFDGHEDSIWMAGDGINHLQELTMECWVLHNAELQGEINRYVTLSGEKAVIRHDNFNLHFYMSFITGLTVYPDNELVIPDEGYNPFTADAIDPNQFTFLLIEDLQPESLIYMNAEFTNADSDFMVWPADMDEELRSYENNIAGSGLCSGRVPEEGSFWLPTDCDSIVVGCFDYSRDDGTWTLHVGEQIMRHIFVPYDNEWDETEFHHVAASYDGSTMRLYMDGELVGQLAEGLPVAPGQGVEISSWYECLDGLIDEVTIYNRALSDDEILSIFEAGGAGKTKPVDDYYLYSRFYSGTETLAGVGGWVEDYGDPDVWGDETQWLYCVGDMTGYKINVTLTDYGPTDPLSPGWIEPHQHPDNPDAPGPVEPRHFEVVGQPVYLSYGGTDYTTGAGLHSDEFHADERGIFLGAWPYGIFQFDHYLNDPDGNGIMNYPADPIAPPPVIPPDPGQMARTETLAYNPDDNIWYAGARCFGWEYRNIYELVDTNQNGDFFDEEWTIAFSYPTLNPTNPAEHHDGLEYAGGYLWISDMYSDVIAQWECVNGEWVERGIHEYTAAAFVEGMGFGPNDHFWSGSLRYQYGQEPHIYEFGGGVLQQELATPVYVDIKPCSWPNPINIKDQGVLPVAICGTPEFDVSAIDPATVTLSCYYNDEVVYPLRWSYEDVATPFLGEPGGGHALDGDGYTDLLLHFDSSEVIETLSLAVKAGEVIPLIVTGEDISPLGAYMRGIDYVWILDQQGIFAPPEFLRFYSGDLGSVAYGDADLSSAIMSINPFSVPYPTLLDSPEYQLGSSLRNGYGLTIINCDKYPLDNAEFRKAFAYALDKYAISSDAWGGHAQPHDSFIPIVNPLCAEGALPVNYYDANIAVGNQLLDDAGFLDRTSDGIREAPDESEFSVTVEYSAYSAVATVIGGLMVEALQNLGVGVIDSPQYTNEYIIRLINHEDFDMAFLGSNLGFDLRPIAEEYHSSNFGVWNSNYPNFVNSEYDYWVEQLLNAEDYEDVQEAAYEVQRIMAEECPIIICYENLVYSAARNPLQNMQVNAMHGGTTYETFVNLEGVYPDFETVTSAVNWPGTLNPFNAPWWHGETAANQGRFNPLTLVYEGLGRLDIDGNLVPQLAKTIDYNAEGQFIDVVLNKDLMWHDGTPFSVWDIFFTLTYLQDHPVGLFAESCSHVVSIAVLNDRQIRIYLDYPSYWTVEALVQVPILPEHIWTDVDDPESYNNELAIGTGSFALYEFNGDEIVLQRWPATTNMEIAYSIGHYYPLAAPYWYQPYHVLQKGTTLTMGFGLIEYGSTAEEAEQNLRNYVDSTTLVITINGKAILDADSGYRWEYLSIDYESSSDSFRAYVHYRYYLKAQPAGDYEIYWSMETSTGGVSESLGYVVWVRG